jgi:hypothetical protein
MRIKFSKSSKIIALVFVLSILIISVYFVSSALTTTDSNKGWKIDAGSFTGILTKYYNNAKAQITVTNCPDIYFIPTNSLEEWTIFKTNKPACISICDTYQDGSWSAWTCGAYTYECEGTRSCARTCVGINCGGSCPSDTYGTATSRQENTPACPTAKPICYNHACCTPLASYYGACSVTACGSTGTKTCLGGTCGGATTTCTPGTTASCPGTVPSTTEFTYSCTGPWSYKTNTCGIVISSTNCANTNQVCYDVTGQCCTPSACPAASDVNCGTTNTQSRGCGLSCSVTGTKCDTGKTCYQGSCCTPTCPAANTICTGTTDTREDGCGGNCNVQGIKAKVDSSWNTCTPSCTGMFCGYQATCTETCNAASCGGSDTTCKSGQTNPISKSCDGWCQTGSCYDDPSTSSISYSCCTPSACPAASDVCSGTTNTQTRGCGLSCNVVGTKSCCTGSCPANLCENNGCDVKCPATNCALGPKQTTKTCLADSYGCCVENCAAKIAATTCNVDAWSCGVSCGKGTFCDTGKTCSGGLCVASCTKHDSHWNTCTGSCPYMVSCGGAMTCTASCSAASCGGSTATCTSGQTTTISSGSCYGSCTGGAACNLVSGSYSCATTTTTSCGSGFTCGGSCCYKSWCVAGFCL